MVSSKNLALITLLCLGFILRVIPMTQSWWLDEAINVRAAMRFSPAELLGTYATGDFHPPLYHLFLYAVLRLLPVSEFVSRIPSLISDMVVLVLTVLMAPKKYRAIVAGLAATNGLMIYYANEARMYAMASMGVSLVFWQLLKRKPRRFTSWSVFRKEFQPSLPDTLRLAALMWFALSFDYLPWLLLPVWLVLAPVATGITVLSSMVWLSLLLTQLQNGLSVASEFPAWGDVVGGFSAKAVALVPVKLLLGRISPSPDWLYGLWAASAVAAIGYGILRLLRLRPGLRSWTLLAWWSVPTGLAILISPFISVLSYFRLLFVLPAVLLMAVEGLMIAPKRMHKLAISVLVVTVSTAGLWYVIDSRWHREDWRSLAQYIDSISVSVVLLPNLAQADPLKVYSSVTLVDSVSLIPAYQDVVYVEYLADIFDPENRIKRGLSEAGYVVTEEVRPRGLVAYRYSLNPALASRSVPDQTPALTTSQLLLE